MNKSKSATGRFFGRIFRKPSQSRQPTVNSTIAPKSDQSSSVPSVPAHSASELNSVPESFPLGSSASTSPTKATTPATTPPASVGLEPTVVPDYLQPPEASSPLHTAGAIVKEFAATLRDTSDMCLPLKAALVPLVKAWDVYDVRARVFCVLAGS